MILLISTNNRGNDDGHDKVIIHDLVVDDLIVDDAIVDNAIVDDESCCRPCFKFSPIQSLLSV